MFEQLTLSVLNANYLDGFSLLKYDIPKEALIQ